MVRLVTFVAILALVFASVQCSENLDNVKVAIVESLPDYLRENPGVKLLQPLKKVVQQSKGVSPLVSINYTLECGKRFNGDRLVATASGSQSWGSPQDSKLELYYPKTGTGSVITFFQVAVEQSSNLGQAYATKGGILERQIAVVIEAKATTYFTYKAEIYGIL